MESLNSFAQANPDVGLIKPDSAEWEERRKTRGQAGHDCKPLGILVPKTADHVAALVKWCKNSGIEFAVRTGGNDFYGRNVVDGGVIIDMRELKSIEVAGDKKCATLGGGVIVQDVIRRLEEDGLFTPVGNTWSIGYVGWATLGGYGPWTNQFGFGFEQIIGAELVNADGDIVKATDEMLEGVRGMGGNLGIITSITIKVYLSRQLLSGMLGMPATEENIRATEDAVAKMDIPKALSLHYFLVTQQARVFCIMFIWSGEDLEEGKKFLETFTAALPTLMMNAVKPVTAIEHFQGMPNYCLPWGGQRSVYLKEMSPAVMDILLEAMQVMGQFGHITWIMPLAIDHATAPANTFGVGTHMLLTLSDMVPDEKFLADARQWNNTLYDKLRSSGDPAVLEGSYPPLTRPEDRTAEQLFADKWPRAKELKQKFDPGNLFKHALPQI